MNLPAIDIPFSLPFEVPLLLHPPLVHFAIVIPVIILLLEIVNAVMKKRAVSVISLFLLVLLSVVLFGAFFTGKVDGSEAYTSMSSDAKAILKEHKLLGTYLAYGSLVLLLLKFLNLTKKLALRVVYLLALIGFVAATLHQGKEGGELVFVHGTNVEAVADLKDELADATEDEDEEDSEDKATTSEDEKDSSSDGDATSTKSDDKKQETTQSEDKTETVDELKSQEEKASTDEAKEDEAKEKPEESSSSEDDKEKSKSTESNETK